MSLFLDSYLPELIVIPKRCNISSEYDEYVFGFDDVFHLETIYGAK
ncbi:hypothetical protein ANCCAN_11940 [Ancylostoma caninum]|uniref:Uncharacterized protein n=1 Tax=Ancylostoma caninum TaxID=29170 RepID=A0A368GGB3_ANCCA|nr:hypothetical protein ANCCAN_11940 [Ancylostoma caninum]